MSTNLGAIHVRHFSYDELSSISPDEMAALVEAYSTTALQRRQAVWDQFDLLRIWLNDEEESSLIRVLPELDSLDYDSHWLNEGAYPAPAKAIETNYRCMMNTRLALDFYRGRETADTVLELSSVDIVGRPFSNIEGNSTESILLRWGRKDAVEAFKRHKMLE